MTKDFNTTIMTFGFRQTPTDPSKAVYHKPACREKRLRVENDNFYICHRLRFCLQGSIMSESEILRWLSVHPDFIKVAKSIITTPQKSSEIVLATGVSELRIAYVLNSLEECRAVTYDAGKWKLTETALKVLEKYFG
jgi:hypothetical protein